MKVLLINNYHFRHGGSETVYFNTADILRQHGHEVIFLSQRRDSNVACDQSTYFSDAIDFQTNGLFKKIKGIKHYFYNNDAAKGLENLLKHETPDIAHLHIFLCGLTMSVVDVLKRHHIPVVNSVHEYRMVCPAYTFKDGNNSVCEDCGARGYWHCVKKRCCKGSLLLSWIMATEMFYRNRFHHPAKSIDAFIFVSKFCKDIHLKYDERFSNKMCEVLYNFRNSDVMENRDDTIETSNSYYLYYGRLSYEKGIKTLIDAFSVFPNERLIVVGTGPIEEDLKSYCVSNNVSNIDFLGFKSGMELYDLVRRARFVVVPSEWYENNPMTIVEAYSLRTPVIGAAIGGISEIIIDNVTGYLFKSGSKDDLVRVLSETLSLSKKNYMKLKKNAESFSDANFDQEIYYKKLMDIYMSFV